eukprot:GSMAST32.ASY1.ANO1.2044.1 assembled CDS
MAQHRTPCRTSKILVVQVLKAERLFWELGGPLSPRSSQDVLESSAVNVGFQYEFQIFFFSYEFLYLTNFEFNFFYNTCWFNHLDPTLKTKKMKWTDAEDQILFDMQKIVGNVRFLHSISNLFFYYENFVPNDFFLLKINFFTIHKWCEISKSLEGRSENSIKNRWNSKKLRIKRNLIPKKTPRNKYSMVAMNEVRGSGVF